MIHRRPKRTLRWGFPLLAFIAVGLASAASHPSYLGENISNVPAGTKTYRIWYSTDCNPGANCDCDSTRPQG
ncbi:MAG: hypothetical protein M5U01_07255 [Ardenticatenaceae bacterium]|nr:hypothetical protein [Ardenticatenaceae bacterium]